MKTLALETSAKSVSVAVTEDGKVLASSYQNIGLTHSVTLMPLLDGMLQNAGLTLKDIDLLAVAAGPGSFTGLRIGVSALKGLAWAEDKPCCGVSTLEAMAQNGRLFTGTVVCAMDARRSQVYNALFRCENGQLTRLCPDRAIGLEELAEEGLIRADPDSGFEEFPAGLLLTVEDSIEADGRHTFSLQKYRSSLGAYCFYDCTARQEGDGWS